MDKDRTERWLRTAFQELRVEEARGAPAFEPLVLPTARPASRRIAPWARLAGAAGIAAALVLALGVFRPGQRQRAADLAAWSALSQWTAATDGLLEPSGARLDGVSITTPSDVWMNSASGNVSPLPNRKETL